MKTLVLTTLTSLSVLFGRAQDDSGSAFTHDIGFNTRFIFEGVFNSQSTPFAMVYKKYTAENRANRYGLAASVNLQDLSDYGTGSYHVYSRAHVRLMLGKEIQRPITQKWVWFYGGDLEPFYHFEETETHANEALYSLSQHSETGINVRPFLAIRYNIHDRLYVSTEASVNCSYSFERQKTELYQPAEPLREAESHNLSLYLGAAYGIFLYYRF